MDTKTIESVLKSIIEIDKQTDEQVQKMNHDIEERKKQLKHITSEIEENSYRRQVDIGRKITERILEEAQLESDRIKAEGSEDLLAMERLYMDQKSILIERVLNKLSLDRWGS